MATIACGDTILGWYRDLIAKKWTFKRKGLGRPVIKQDVRGIIVRLATENLTWGCTRILGGLKNLGIKTSRGTVANVLSGNGIVPAPERGGKTPWKTFLKAHWEVLAAADFLTAEVWTKCGLVTYYVFFVIELKTRRVKIAGVTPNPDGRFMAQVARTLTDCYDGFLLGKKIQLRDGDKKYTRQFNQILSDGGIESKQLPARSPNLNAYAERFVLTLKSECLNRMIFIGERSLRRSIGAYMEHYHHERSHQGMNNEIIIPFDHAGQVQGAIQRKQRLGGMLRYYYRVACVFRRLSDTWSDSYRTVIPVDIGHLVEGSKRA